MTWLDLLLLVLACYRLTHLVVFDSITAPLRSRLAPVPFIGELVDCYWCCGIWVSGFLLAGWALWPAGFRPLVLLLAIAGGQALLESWIRRE